MPTMQERIELARTDAREWDALVAIGRILSFPRPAGPPSELQGCRAVDADEVSRDEPGEAS